MQETCSQLDKDNFYKEIVVMAQFMHPNIVRVFGSVDKGEYLTVCMGSSIKHTTQIFRGNSS